MARTHKPEISPVDLPAEPIEGGHPLLWTSITIIVAALILLATNAFTIRAWANELEPSETQAKLVEIATVWQDWTDSAGLGAPRAAMNALWKKAQAARFAE